MSQDIGGDVQLLEKMVVLLMADCCFWRAERRAPFVPISEATLVPAAIRPVSPCAYEHNVTRSATVAVLLCKYRALGRTNDRFCPWTPRALFEQDFESPEVISHLIGHW